MQWFDSLETYAHGTSQNLVCKKEETKCSNVIKQYKHDELWWCYKRNYKRA